MTVEGTDHRQDDAERGGVYVIFDGPPGPEAGRFVEVEDADGNSIRAGEWADRGDGYWSLHVGVLAPGDTGYDAGYDDGLRVARESWATEKNVYEARIASLERTIDRAGRELGGRE